jgi:hypothetical protein
MAGHLERVAWALPSSSWTHIYAGLYQIFVRRLDEPLCVQQGTLEEFGENDDCTSNSVYADWWNSIDGGSIDLSNWVDMGFFDSDQRF